MREIRWSTFHNYKSVAIVQRPLLSSGQGPWVPGNGDGSGHWAEAGREKSGGTLGTRRQWVGGRESVRWGQHEEGLPVSQSSKPWVMFYCPIGLCLQNIKARGNIIKNSEMMTAGH